MKYLGPPQSGSVAAVTYSRNQFGQYTRLRAGRGGVGNSWPSNALGRWRSFSDVTRASWEGVKARPHLNDGALLSGWQAFAQAYFNASATTGWLPLPNGPRRIAPLSDLLVRFDGYDTGGPGPLFAYSRPIAAGEAIIWGVVRHIGTHAQFLIQPGQKFWPPRGGFWKSGWVDGDVGATGTGAVSFPLSVGQSLAWRWRVIGPDYRSTPWTTGLFTR